MGVTAYIFPTAIGSCAIAHTSRGICGLRLPAGSDAQLLRQLQRHHGAIREASTASPPSAVHEIIERIQRHLDGGGGDPDSMAEVALDLRAVTPFARSVYRQARRIGPGRTISYGELARRSGCPGGARAVGQAMAANPVPLLIPCHRVLASGGGLGGFSARGGTATKLRLLALEGADLREVAGAGTRALSRRDAKLAKVIRRVGRLRLLDHDGKRRGDPFTALAEAIVHQQVSMKAGATIFGRLRKTVGDRAALDPGRLLQARPEELRAAGLSRQKASYLRDLAERTLGGSLPLGRLERMDDEQVIQRLTQVKGIGRWSAEMYLIFRLGRLDVLPTDDLGLRKGAQQLYGLRQLPTADTLQRLARTWVPFRSIATWYIWRFLDAGGL